MYVVRNKKSLKIVHVNPAPLSQQLDGTEVYFKFNPKTMEIGRWEGRALPESFEIDEQGQVVTTVAEPAETASATRTGLRVDDLPPVQKIVGEGEDAQIVTKSVAELASEGLISRDEVYENSIRRLRGEIATRYRLHRTPSGFRLDDLAREKLIFSAIYRQLPESDARKKEMLEAGLIYPDAQVDEMLEEIRKLQETYRNASALVKQGFAKGRPVEKWADVSLEGTAADGEPSDR